MLSAGPVVWPEDNLALAPLGVKRYFVNSNQVVDFTLSRSNGANFPYFAAMERDFDA